MQGCQIRRESAHGESVCCNNVRALFDELPTPHLIVEITPFPSGTLTEKDYTKAEQLEKVLRSRPSVWHIFNWVVHAFSCTYSGLTCIYFWLTEALVHNSQLDFAQSHRLSWISVFYIHLIPIHLTLHRVKLVYFMSLLFINMFLYQIKTTSCLRQDTVGKVG